MADAPTDRRHVLDHPSRVAGMCDARGLGDVIEHATPQHPAMRDLPVGEAVKARGRKGLGCLKPARSLVPRFCQQQPPARLLSPRVVPAQLNDAALGRALEPLDDSGVTARSRLMAVTAAPRRGLHPTSPHLDRRRLPVEGRAHRDEAPAAQVMPSPRGDSRAPRPARHHVLLALMVEPQAGLPRLRPPRSGHSREAHACGQVSRAPLEQLHPTDGATDVVADRALSRQDNLPQLAHSAGKWSTRVPATLPEAPTA
jgi:Domain of unknown function (DUF4277)